MGDKDDDTVSGGHVYTVLFVLFIGLGCLGLLNFYSAHKQDRLWQNKSVLLFYLSSLFVILFRLILFTDQWVGYSWDFYVIGLITLPTFLYLITGLSQVMLSVECIIKYKILEIDEAPELSICERQAGTKRAKHVLLALYWMIGLAMGAIFLTFFVWAFYCKFTTDQICQFEKSASLVLPIAVLNLVIWALLLATTLFFVRTINKRFGAAFRPARIKLLLFMTLFSLSFGLRGSWDIAQYADDRFMAGATDEINAATMFFIYFVCEWLPIFVIYLHHRQDFMVEHVDSKQLEEAVDRATALSDLKQGNMVLIYSPSRVKRIFQ